MLCIYFFFFKLAQPSVIRSSHLRLGPIAIAASTAFASARRDPILENEFRTEALQLQIQIKLSQLIVHQKRLIQVLHRVHIDFQHLVQCLRMHLVFVDQLRRQLNVLQPGRIPPSHSLMTLDVFLRIYDRFYILEESEKRLKDVYE